MLWKNEYKLRNKMLSMIDIMCVISKTEKEVLEIGGVVQQNKGPINKGCPYNFADFLPLPRVSLTTKSTRNAKKNYLRDVSLRLNTLPPPVRFCIYFC